MEIADMNWQVTLVESRRAHGKFEAFITISLRAESTRGA